MLREGALASYVGPDRSSGALAGDRCTILSDESTYATVRWVTGRATSAFEAIPSSFLVGDARTKLSAFDDDYDEFGFEAAPPRRMPVASAAVCASGGHTALFRALDAEGMFSCVRTAAVDAVRSVLGSLEADPSWAEVTSELADGATDFTAHVLASVLQAAVNEIRRTHGQEATPL